MWRGAWLHDAEWMNQKKIPLLLFMKSIWLCYVFVQIVVLSESLLNLCPHHMFIEDPQSIFMGLKDIWQHIFLQWFVSTSQHKEQESFCT